MKKNTSRSTYRAYLNIQSSRDHLTGLYAADRRFLPEKAPSSHILLWLLLDTMLVLLLLGGLTAMLLRGLGIASGKWLLLSQLMTAAAVAAYWRLPNKTVRWTAFFALLLAFLTLLYIRQDSFLAGLGQLGNQLIASLNEAYSGHLEPLSRFTGTDHIPEFLAFAAIPAAAWLALSLIHLGSFRMSGLLVFPAAVLLILCGAGRDILSLFLLTFSILLSAAFTRPVRQRRMWGGNDRVLLAENTRRFESIRKKGMLSALLLGAFLTLPGFLLLGPLLSSQLKGAEQTSLELQGKFLNQAAQLLPQISAGRWNLNLETAGGGVQDGSLTGESGYYLEKVEDLLLTLSEQPSEVLFLKGFIGASYSDGSWHAGHESVFDAAAMNWKTDGNARLYIQNLPFLRVIYAAQSSRLEPVQLLVQRLNANDDYTYLPYSAFLNDYYILEGGDGTVLGQTAQEDRFLFFFRGDAQEILSIWNAQEDTASLLDRAEESYRAYCATAYADISALPDTITAEVKAVRTESHWDSSHLEQISAWIRTYLSDNYSYELQPDASGDGTDPLTDFLLNTRCGNSVHFASAAVLLYRAFGIPARYCVGYEIPPALFTAQANGTWTATAQGDNAQAWAEIYIPGIGWSPRDMTPGVIGTYEEVGPYGERLEARIESEEEEETLDTEQASLTEDVAQEALQNAAVRQENTLSVLELTKRIALSASGLLLLLLAVLWGHRFCLAFGLDPFHRRSLRQRFLGIFRALYRRMLRLGLPADIRSIDDGFLSFADKLLCEKTPQSAQDFSRLLILLDEICYGRGEVTSLDISRLRSLYLTLLRLRRRRRCES